MKIFLAGIMQGSLRGEELHDQDYRQRIKRQLETYLDGADVYDPLADHGNSLDYDEDRGRQVFFHHVELCGQVDVVLAFVPEASMGTAIEMWDAYRHGRVVLTISPLKHNWAVRFLSHHMYDSLESFEAALQSGRVADVIERAKNRIADRRRA